VSMFTDKPKRSYDVVIIGSGAAGAQVAYSLAMDGVRVLIIEAGRRYDPPTETPMFQIWSQAPLRGSATPDRAINFYDASIAIDKRLEPYTNASTNPSQQLDWERFRMLGGRTNHFSRNVFRYGPEDFKGRTRDGLGLDWPISYEDLQPYYDRVEMLIGVYGTNESVDNMMHSPAGVLLPPPRPRAGELYIQKHAKALGLPVIPIHRAVLTQPLDYQHIPPKLHPHNSNAQRILAADMKSRSACFFATDCHRGCSIRANYQSPTVHLPPALATGNLDIVTNAMAREITIGRNGRASGVIYVDKKSGHDMHVAGRIVVLAASSYESVRLLFNSKSASFPNGIATSSGLLGRYITNFASLGGSLNCQVPAFESLPLMNEDGAGGYHVHIPWWLYAEHRAGKLDFPRGYRINFQTGRQLPQLTTFAGLEWVTRGSYGPQFKEDARRYYGSFVSFGAPGEMIPNDDTFCEVDPVVRDRWGIPVLRFHWAWSDYERRQGNHKRKTLLSLVEALGGKVRGSSGAGAVAADPGANHEPGGAGEHDLGGAIMGTNPSNSVVNQWCQTWDVANLFVTDGAVFCSNSHLTPTLTIMALAWRAADYMMAKMARGDL
jgi:choline dehydrogenase-like flavoprotein